MVEKKVLNKVSITGRFAFAMFCIERLLAQWGVAGNMSEDLLQFMWKFAGTRDLDGWNAGMRDRLSNLESSGVLTTWFGPKEASHRVEVLKKVLHLVHYIAVANDCAAFDSERTLTPTIDVAALAMREGVSPPQVKAFLCSPARECEG